MEFRWRCLLVVAADDVATTSFAPPFCHVGEHAR